MPPNSFRENVRRHLKLETKFQINETMKRETKIWNLQLRILNVNDNFYFFQCETYLVFVEIIAVMKNDWIVKIVLPQTDYNILLAL